MFEVVRQDLHRHVQAWRPLSPRLAYLHALCSYGFIAVAHYRFGKWTQALRPRWLGFPFKLGYLLTRLPVHLLFGIDISLNANVGPGLYIGHFGGIFLHGSAGRNLVVGQDVTVGYKGAGMSDYTPVLGDDVYLGAGAKVIGDIRVGDRAVIGANTVVTKDVPADTRVVGAGMRMTAMTGGGEADRDADCRGRDQPS